MSMVSPRDLVAVARTGTAVSKDIKVLRLVSGWLTAKSHFDAAHAVNREAAVEAEHGFHGSPRSSGGGFGFGEPTDEFGMTPVGGRRKRVVDLVVAATLAVLLSPLLLLTALAVKLCMGGPVIYHHRRVGFAGRPFDCLKFRTMVANGDEAKPAIITEAGWNDHPRWTRAVRPGQRITNTLRAYEIAENEWPWLQAICFWVFRFPWDAKSYQDYYTFVRTDFEPKPIYTEVQRYAAGEEAP